MGFVVVRLHVRCVCIACALQMRCRCIARRRGRRRRCWPFAVFCAHKLLEFGDVQVVFSADGVGAYEARLLAVGEAACDVRSGHFVEEKRVEYGAQDGRGGVVAAVVVDEEEESDVEVLVAPREGVEGLGGDKAVSDVAVRHGGNDGYLFTLACFPLGEFFHFVCGHE